MIPAIALAQINPIVGDIDGNRRKIEQAYGQAKKDGAALVIFPEMCLSGYPPLDLIQRPDIWHKCAGATEDLAKLTLNGPAMVFGGPAYENHHLYNAAFWCDEGRVMHRQFKHSLPNYGVFDEKRYFTAGPLPSVFTWRGLKIGLLICEDLWTPHVPLYLLAGQPDLLITINGSPFEVDKVFERLALAASYATLANIPFIYVNQVGGQDELVFDGDSFAVNGKGEVILHGGYFKESLTILTTPHRAVKHHTLTREAAMYEALVLGLRDYVQKNGFSDVCLGLSGGIDSALCLAIAVDALGPAHVHSLMMASPYTAKLSKKDAKLLAKKLGVTHQEIALKSLMQNMDKIFTGLFAETTKDLTAQNVQPRLRGTILMGLSNQTGALLLACGNKSELATGYATLYGDMCGAYAPLKDVYKTDVYRLVEYRNQHYQPGWLGPKGTIFQKSLLEKDPSAELKDNQKDQDSLPPYPVLDAILHELIERNLPPASVEVGTDSAVVERVYKLLKTSEYKRFQAAPGPKVSSRHLGTDWRYPLTNKG